MSKIPRWPKINLPDNWFYPQDSLRKIGIVEAARYKRNETCWLFARKPLIWQTVSNRRVFVYISWLEYTFHYDLKSNKDMYLKWKKRISIRFSLLWGGNHTYHMPGYPILMLTHLFISNFHFEPRDRPSFESHSME